MLLTLFLASACNSVDALRITKDMHDVQMSLAHFGRQSSPPGSLPDAQLSSNEYFSELRSRILNVCGQACEIAPSKGKGRFFDIIEKKNQCDALFHNNMTNFDALSNLWPPPKHIPEVMRNDFLMGQNFTVEDWYIQESQASKQKREPTVWTPATLSQLTNAYTTGNFGVRGSYGSKDTKMIYDLLNKHKAELEGKHCAVLGSQSPWLEALLLHVGVGRVTTIEYKDITSTHPQIETIRPSDWANWHNTNQASGLFDCVASYSSLEHAGLGRYGDVVNPWGDFIAMGKLSCSTKKDGLLFIGMPDAAYGTGGERIAWNAHRYYGPHRWAQIMANTEQLDYEYPDLKTSKHAMVVGRKL